MAGQAHAVAVNLVPFHARFCFKHPLRLFVPDKKKLVTVVHGSAKNLPVQTNTTIADRVLTATAFAVAALRAVPSS